MSSAECASGCTDCPTCRGDVQPDAPIMKDMVFAMAMGGGPMSADRFLGPLSIVQTVRDAVRRRGDDGASSTVMRFLDALAQHVTDAEVPLVGMDRWDDGPAGGPKGGGAGLVFADWSPWDRGPGGHPQETPQVSEDLDKWGLPSPSGRDESTQSPGWCCVEEFLFWSRRGRPTFSKTAPEGQRLTTQWKGSSVPAVSLSFLWNTRAKFIEDPGQGCLCICCEYRQYVLFNVLEVTHGGSKEADAPPGGAREDCIFVVLDKDKNGIPETDPDTGEPKRSTERALPGYTPPGTKGQDWWGPLCAGHRDKQGEGDPFDPPTTYPPADGGCVMKKGDQPTRGVPCDSTFAWEIGFMGIIHDACWFYIPRRWRSFSVFMRGAVDSACNGVVTTQLGEGGWSRPAKRPK